MTMRMVKIVYVLVHLAWFHSGITAFHPFTCMHVQPKSQRMTTLVLKSAEQTNNDHELLVTGWTDNGNGRQSRRDALSDLIKWTVAFGLGMSVINGGDDALAYEKNYPLELKMEEGTTDPSKDLQFLRKPKIESKRAEYQKDLDYSVSLNPLEFRGPKDFFTSVTWGGALWLLSGSRSNPLATPLANLLYDDKEEAWLKDRNEGLFAPLPLPYLFVLGIVFFFLGVAADRFVLFLADGDTGVSLQLAGVSLIGGGALELGRLASGEKKQTRQDSDRDTQLAQEFVQFAQQRLLPGGNCHRSDVIRAFRRYYAKYRQADNPDFPLSDLDIERLLRSWTRTLSNVEISSAGFYKGVQINEDADVFVKR